MSCDVYQKLLFEYEINALPAGIKHFVKDHLHDCENCRGIVSDLNKLSKSITEYLKTTTMSLAITSNIESRVLKQVSSIGLPSSIDYQWDKLFDDLPFWQRIQKILFGLRQPPDTGDYKWAKLQVKRLWSPAAAIVVPLLMLCVFAALAHIRPKPMHSVPIQIVEMEQVEELEDPEEIIEPEFEPPDPEEVADTTDQFNSTSREDVATPDTDFSPQPAMFDAVAIIKSPVSMKGIFGSRSPGARGSAMARFGAPPAAGGAVLRALRWLKKHQLEDGSWDTDTGGGVKPKYRHPDGITGLALLTYLAHGETPSSVEFGKTVEKAIKFLLASQQADGVFQRRAYDHAIATYALCEAYSMTHMPSLLEAATRATEVIVRGQNVSGGYDYRIEPSARNDSSIMGWTSQALKAAKMAGVEVSGLDKCIEKSIKGWKKNYFEPKGGFGYAAPGASGITAAGALGVQLLGKPESQMAKRGVDLFLAKFPFNWKGKFMQHGGEVAGWQKVYYWYYGTQAVFHEGGDKWRNWNKQFSKPLIYEQIVVAGAIADPTGKMVDIGYWDTQNEKGGRVMDTALCTLMLEVYYRYLPTFQKPEEIVAEGEALVEAEEEKVIEGQDLDIDVQM